MGAWVGEGHAGAPRPIVVGIINVTPDSFSDGGHFFSLDTAIAHAARLVDDGADVLDIGGESTRPGAESISTDEEIQRVVPVVRELARAFPQIRLSVDTTKAGVACAALQAGATIVNDVSALRLDEQMADTCAEFGATVILMHSRGHVADMALYEHATYNSGVMSAIIQELTESLSHAHRAGVRREAIVLDPGVGFSKRSEHSLEALGDLGELTALGYPVMVGASRKRFVGELAGNVIPEERDAASVGAHVAALSLGASWFRVHNVRMHRHALDVAHAVLSRAVQPVQATAVERAG